MNQDQVKTKLLELDPSVDEFSLIFSGKASKKVNGLYKPDVREILIHNKNFEDDNSLMYTAIHEFAHHVHHCRTGSLSTRAHTVEFRSILHDLLEAAEQKTIYLNRVDAVPELKQLAAHIREQYMKVNGDLMKNFGQTLMEAEKLCRKHQARFEDFIERALQLPRATATSIMRIKALDLPSELGYENMKTLATIRNNQLRNEATQALLDGTTLDQLKQDLSERPSTKQPDPLKKLAAEKKRIERSLENLRARLNQIEQELSELGFSEPDPQSEETQT